ncbi:hypothetical protein [Wenxinia marina]|uniref:Wenxma_21, whole genome shotgun sequence n=1 Tax=Wenxinia marina DSM 24838 TaxID=1123501 RepID=A0A0D0Q4V9_9RHOB|nr:hypothetical protein [Wenxinia marina]KIQ67567.1 hypothetical protein Wenmar_03993 [Wenxinia marina DSM 24838]GGL68415.1 hypothetical protein GCM10011392_23640 [Wenxinia marina]
MKIASRLLGIVLVGGFLIALAAEYAQGRPVLTRRGLGLGVIVDLLRGDESAEPERRAAAPAGGSPVPRHLLNTTNRPKPAPRD